MTTTDQVPVPLWRQALAYTWYAWGLSLCYWGIRWSTRTLFRSGVRAFDRAVRVWPEFAGGFYQRGRIRGRELGEHVEAIADLTRAIELSASWPDPYLLRGLLQRFHGDPQAALNDLQHYLTLSSDSDWRAEAEHQIATLQADMAEDSHTSTSSTG